MACRSGLPTLCCDCPVCTHRRFGADLSAADWSRHVYGKKGLSTGNEPPQTPVCDGTVIDLAVRGDYVYLLYESNDNRPAEGIYSGSYRFQRWTTAGDFLWDKEVPNTRVIGTEDPTQGNGFLPRRIDSDNSQVWICGGIQITGYQQGTLWAFDVDDGTYLWDAGSGAAESRSFYDLDPGAGGTVYVGSTGGGTNCEPNASLGTGSGSGTGDAGYGYCFHYDSSGTLLRRFGVGTGNIAYSVLYHNSKVWVGSDALDTDCFCNSLAFDHGNPQMSGYLARYDASGNFELLTCTGRWVTGVSSVGLTLMLDPNFAYINRLCESPDGNILAGTHLSRDIAYSETQCDVLEFDPTSGELLNSWQLSSLVGMPDTTVEAIASTGTAWYAVADNLVYPQSGAARRHRGYMSNTTTIVDGQYNAVGATTDKIIVGGTPAGCTLTDTETLESAEPCAASQPCECGDFNTRGEAVVGCGCDDAIGCERYIEFQFTGCLAEFSGRIDQFKYYGPGNSDPYGHCGANECTGEHRWIGTTTGNINVGTGTPNCVTGVTLAVFVCYNCAGTGSGTNPGDWSIHLCFYNGDGRQLAITPRITSEGCGPPHFTFEFDSASDIVDFIRNDGVGSTLDANDCCAFFTVCGGMNTSGCGVDFCGCPNTPSTLTATITNVSCDAAYTGQTFTLTWNGSYYAYAGMIAGKDHEIWLDCQNAGTNQVRLSSPTGPECVVSGTPLAIATCVPFDVTFTNVAFATVFGSGCGCVSGLVDIHITA